ncbi:MAG: hypothetical protein A4E57_00860 [Syntrophorhabdaceae bacterium PtaU1.Bin034]|jgi:hypothetical protein|nr:MAG: hypothetical protein A4E57_00860 [Syntrophorhabdaceae bacterium PtaU1.Bin034]
MACFLLFIERGMMNKIAIPHHLGYVSPVFDVARNILAVSVRDGQELGREEALLESTGPFLRAQELKSLGVDLLVCGAISRPYEIALLSKGIEVRHSLCGLSRRFYRLLFEGPSETHGSPCPVSADPVGSEKGMGETAVSNAFRHEWATV